MNKSNNKTNRNNLDFRLTKIAAKILLIIIIINGGLFSSAFAQCNYAPAIPDYSFGNAGEVTTNINPTEFGADIVVQPDGKVIIAGNSLSTGSTGWDFTIIRYNPNGSIDTTFGTSGIAKLDFSNRIDLVSGIALQSNGKIVLVGSTCVQNDNNSCNFAIARLNPNGIPDITFGNLRNAGKITTDFAGLLDDASKVAIQTDGKIVVVGRTLINAGNFNYAIVRYNSNGTLDTSFNGDGKAAFSVSNGGANDLAIQPDGKIVAVGSGNSDFGVLRVTSNGLPDASFGNIGQASIDFGGNDIANTVALTTNGKIVLGGSAQLFFGAFNDSAIVRLNSNGTLDNSFDGDGKITNSLTSTNDGIADIVVKPSGEIISLANMDNPQTYVLFTYTANSLNPCFFYYSSYNADNRFLAALATQGSKFYTAGAVSINQFDFLVMVLETNIPM